MQNLIYLASTQYLFLLNLYLNLPPTLKQLYFESLSERMFELSYSLVGMKLAQLLSCRVLTPTCWVDQMDRVSRENSFKRQSNTFVDRPSYRSTTRDSSVY